MSVFIYTDRGFCTLRDGDIQWMMPDDLVASGMVRDENVTVLLGGVEYRQVQGKNTRGVLPDGFMVREERLKGGNTLVLGAREEMLRVVYDVFKAGKIKACVPYGLAVRAFLLSRGMDLEDVLYLVVDDAGERVFITVIDGAALVETRELDLQDAHRLVEEVRRSEKRCLERSPSRAGVKIVSNHQGFLEAVAQVRSAEDIIAIDGKLFVFDVMSKALFGIHFTSPQEDAVRERQARWRQGLMKNVLPFVLCTGSVLFAVMMSQEAMNISLRTKALAGDISRKETTLKERLLKTCDDRVRKSRTMSWEESFINLVNSISGNWSMQSVVWETRIDRGEQLSAVVIRDEAGAFEGKGILINAELSPEIVNGRPAIRIFAGGKS
ncbi:MAG: hypothetical protein HQL22_06530 [Candidatus Omnitrophica bacterium]|nr:hypothetical protein [Candidatus Omnitrophota bacterium]